MILILCIIILFLLIVLSLQNNIESFLWGMPTRINPLYDIRGDPNMIYVKVNGIYIPIGYWYNFYCKKF
jgi:hypothetical protein